MLGEGLAPKPPQLIAVLQQAVPMVTIPMFYNPVSSEVHAVQTSGMSFRHTMLTRL